MHTCRAALPHTRQTMTELAAENEKDQPKSGECQINGESRTEAEDMAEEPMLEVQDKQREARGAKTDRLHLHSRQS